MKTKINMKRYFQVLGISLAVILVLIMVPLGFSSFGPGSNVEEGLTEEEIATVKADGGKVNVLAMGVDKDGLRTDAIMLVSYDTEANTVKALSIPRDTRMYVGSKYQKINAAHAVGSSKGKPLGAQGTVEAVTRLTNVPINYYIEFSFDGVEKCMDALGPVEFEIPDLNNDGVGMVYDDPVQDLHINLKPGLQELDGEQIVHLLRYRKGNKINGVRRTYANGDIDRIAVQQDFIKALVDQKLNASLILKIPSIFKQVSSELKTNLTVKDVLKYSKYLGDLSSTNVSIFSLPGNFSGGQYDASYWICDLDATRELIETEFGYDASDITIDKSSSAKSSDSDGKKTTTKSSDKSSSSEKTTKTSKSSSSTNKSNTEKNSSEEQEDSENKSSTKNSSTKKATQTPKPTTKTQISIVNEEDNEDTEIKESQSGTTDKNKNTSVEAGQQKKETTKSESVVAPTPKVRQSVTQRQENYIPHVRNEEVENSSTVQKKEETTPKQPVVTPASTPQPTPATPVQNAVPKKTED